MSQPRQFSLSEEGATFALELSVEEDLEKQIEQFVRLNRLGEYGEAQTYFDETLRRHLHFFPVIAEYADMLLQQGAFKDLYEFIGELKVLEMGLKDEERRLLRLLEALARMHFSGALRPALREAEHVRQYLEELRANDSPSDIQIHLFEAYLHVVVFIYNHTDWVSQDTITCPFSPGGSNSIGSLMHWYSVLRKSGLFWEAYRVLKTILALFLNEPVFLYDESDLEALPDNSPTSGLWAEFMIQIQWARCCLDCAILRETFSRHTAAKYYYHHGSHFLNTAESILTSIEARGAVTSRPLELKLAFFDFDMARDNFTDSEFQVAPASVSEVNSLLFDANSRNDYHMQINVRVRAFFLGMDEPGQWRDLHSLFELLNTAGNYVASVQLYAMLTQWAEGHAKNGNLSHWPHLSTLETCNVLRVINRRKNTNPDWWLKLCLHQRSLQIHRHMVRDRVDLFDFDLPMVSSSESFTPLKDRESCLVQSAKTVRLSGYTQSSLVPAKNQRWSRARTSSTSPALARTTPDAFPTPMEVYNAIPTSGISPGNLVERFRSRIGDNQADLERFQAIVQNVSILGKADRLLRPGVLEDE